MIKQNFTAIVHREGNIFIAQCPEIGTASQGNTVEEAVSNLKEATELYLEEFPLTENVEPPLVITFEAVHD